MSVSNGQIANASTFNSAFLSKTTDDVKAAKLGLNDTIDPFSGGSIDNVQGLLNELIFTIGNAGENDSNRNAYSSNVVISDGDSRKTAIEKLDAAFTGLTGSNGYYAEYQSTTFNGAAGVDDTVTSSFSGKVSGGGASAAGVVTSAPNNRCEIRDSSTLKAIDDGAGNLVYGRITESSGTWTLSYYSNVSGVETAYSFSSTNIKIYFPEVFTSLTRPTVPQLTGELSSVSGSGGSTSDDPKQLLNCGISASVASNALTAALKTKSGSDPSSGSPVSIAFRSSTLTSGQYTVVNATSATSVVVPDTATLGHGDASTHYVWVYALNNSGSIELAVSSSRFDEGLLHSTTAIGTGSDSGGVLYSTTARTNAPIRLIGRITSNQATAGTWATTPSEVSVDSSEWFIGEDLIVLSSDSGAGSTNTQVRRYSFVESVRARSMYHSQSAANGDSITIVANGTYNVSTAARYTSVSNQNCAITVDSTTLPNRRPFPGGVAAAPFDALAGGVLVSCSRTLYLPAESVIRMVTGSGSLTSSDSEPQHLSVVRVD